MDGRLAQSPVSGWPLVAGETTTRANGDGMTGRPLSLARSESPRRHREHAAKASTRTIPRTPGRTESKRGRMKEKQLQGPPARRCDRITDFAPLCEPVSPPIITLRVIEDRFLTDNELLYAYCKLQTPASAAGLRGALSFPPFRRSHEVSLLAAPTQAAGSTSRELDPSVPVIRRSSNSPFPLVSPL